MSWYFTCKHVSLFKISLYYMYIFAKFMYNDYIRPYVLLHIVPIIFASDLTGGGEGGEQACQHDCLVSQPFTCV